MQERISDHLPLATYLLAFHNKTVKDLTQKYSSHFNTALRKLRVNAKWWETTLKPYKPRQTKIEKKEDEELERKQLEQPLPTYIAQYKNHPLYVLKRHLLKYEAIYPPTAPIVGFVRKEEVYSRECVYKLHPRDIWYKQAKVVKPGEKAYKIVKGRPRWDKVICYFFYIPGDSSYTSADCKHNKYQPRIIRFTDYIISVLCFGNLIGFLIFIHWAL